MNQKKMRHFLPLPPQRKGSEVKLQRKLNLLFDHIIIIDQITKTKGEGHVI